ncbi:hypothetical protein PRZ48_002635 [Zasmidium cellare]|uniref:RRM domain-containing protein n=1 Tax=Zasmidium cellare TaxID=395010 RepID=A0ABR0ETF8_ZASCE|nr:hypothetical protein PRZ48_002635 [Zasmidium cellare]
MAGESVDDLIARLAQIAPYAPGSWAAELNDMSARLSHAIYHERIYMAHQPPSANQPPLAYQPPFVPRPPFTVVVANLPAWIKPIEIKGFMGYFGSVVNCYMFGSHPFLTVEVVLATQDAAEKFIHAAQKAPGGCGQLQAWWKPQPPGSNASPEGIQHDQHGSPGIESAEVTTGSSAGGQGSVTTIKFSKPISELSFTLPSVRCPRRPVDQAPPLPYTPPMPSMSRTQPRVTYLEEESQRLEGGTFHVGSVGLLDGSDETPRGVKRKAAEMTDSSIKTEADGDDEEAPEVGAAKEDPGTELRRSARKAIKTDPGEKDSTKQGDTEGTPIKQEIVELDE